MTVQKPHTVRWGIISTGGIATEFTADLLTDPALRGASDVRHVVQAVGSRSVESAQKFLDRVGAIAEGPSAFNAASLKHTKAYGTYQEVYDDSDVDIIYIGTPVTLHHRNAKDALLAGKHVLCEKAFTYDVAELDELIALARQKGLFLMEAVWTRFHPISYEVQKVLESGVLGRPKRFAADFSKDFGVDARPVTDRFLDPALGGGSLLDMGPYPSVWAMLMLHRHPLNTRREPPEVVGTYQKVYARTCVDARSRWLLDFSELGAEAALMTDLAVKNCGNAAVVLSCERADLVIESPPQKPHTFHIVPHEDRTPGDNGIDKHTTHHCPVPAEHGHGLMYEADAVARCLRDGKTECERMPLAESRIVQSWFDAVRQRGTTALRDMPGTAGL